MPDAAILQFRPRPKLCWNCGERPRSESLWACGLCEECARGTG